MFLDLVYLLRRYGVPAGLDQALDFVRGLRRGLAPDLERVFLLARLCFVRRPEQMDSFERAFALYFFGIDLPPVAEGDPALLETKQFRDWLRAAIQRGEIQPITQNLSEEELMRRFWETIRQQTAAHHGGNRWVGTGGASPFGHGGFSNRGLRVYGESGNRGALRVFGDRRYLDYSDDHSLSGANLRQALGELRKLEAVGAETELDAPETIHRSAKNGGEIELVFRRERRDRIKVIALIDNGGSSMTPFIERTRLLFQKLRDRFHDCEIFFFHNTIYDQIYRDAQRTRPYETAELLKQDAESRLLFIGDASMAPEELYSAWGASSWNDASAEASIHILRRLRQRFVRSVWLNPIPAQFWQDGQGTWSLERIREVFRMEELSLRGLKRAVAFLNGK